MRLPRALLSASSSVALAAIVLWACSDNGSAPATDTPYTPTPTTTRSDGGSTSPPPGTGDSGSTSPGDAGADCGKPAKLFPEPADGGMFCPFSGTNGGKDIYCGRTDTCCQPPKSANTASTCVSGKTTTCPTPSSTAWECEGPLDCAGGQVCCAYGNGAPVALSTDTCGPYLSKFEGTKCEATCAAGELAVCSQASECPNGKTCTAVKPKGNDIGVCN